MNYSDEAKKLLVHYFQMVSNDNLSRENLKEIESIIEIIGKLIDQKIDIHDDMKFNYHRDTRDMED